MTEEQAVWELYKDTIKLGTITPYGWYDFPWIGCHFEPKPEFEEYRHLFDKAVELIEQDWSQELDDTFQEINRLFQLIPLGKTGAIKEFMLYIDGAETRVKCIFAEDSLK